MTTESPKRRRWFQFRLRTLLIAILVLSLPLSWLAWKMEKAKRQREAVERIFHQGGQVFYDDESYGWVAEEHFPGPEQRRWLRQVLGVDLFSNVWKINLGEADIENVAALPQLRYLSAYDVADADLEHVARLTQLLELHLFYGQLTDAGLVTSQGVGSVGTVGVGRHPSHAGRRRQAPRDVAQLCDPVLIEADGRGVVLWESAAPGFGVGRCLAVREPCGARYLLAARFPGDEFVYFAAVLSVGVAEVVFQVLVFPADSDFEHGIGDQRRQQQGPGAAKQDKAWNEKHDPRRVDWIADKTQDAGGGQFVGAVGSCDCSSSEDQQGNAGCEH